MAELLKQSFELFVKKRWLKTIDKECDKYNKIKSKLSRQQYVVNSLLAEYKKIYGERFLDDKLFTTPLSEGSVQYTEDDNPYKDLKGKLGSALQAAYELPLAYWLGNNEKDWYNKSLGIVVERVKDVAKNISTNKEATSFK